MDDIELRLVSGVHTWMQMCLYAWTKQMSPQKNTDNTLHRWLKNARASKMHHLRTSTC